MKSAFESALPTFKKTRTGAVDRDDRPRRRPGAGRRRFRRDRGDHVLHEHLEPDAADRGWLVAKKAVARGLKVKPYVKTSFARLAGRERLPRQGWPDPYTSKRSASTTSDSAA